MAHYQTTIDGRPTPVDKTNLYESLPRLPTEGQVTRRELLRRLVRLCDEVLPYLATREDYPIRFDHCFRRVAYDVAAGVEWTERVDRPFVKNAGWLLLSRAYRVAAWMTRGGRPAVEACNDYSLELRGVSR